MPVLDVLVGRAPWSLEFRPADLTIPPRPPAERIADARGAVVAALERPIRFEAFRRALTPDDRIALVVDESLPQLPALIAGVLEYLNGVGIPSSAVTALSPAGSTQAWVNDLPEVFADLKTEIHAPDDRKKLGYLSATKENTRVYLNRTIVDADQTVVLSGRGYDPLLGYSGAEGHLYPQFADADLVKGLIPKISPQQDLATVWPVRHEAIEVAWLLGSPFFVQVIEGDGDDLSDVVAGLGDTTADGIALLNHRWKSVVPHRPDFVIVTLTGDPARHDFAALARAAACGARVVKPGGPVVILSESDPDLGEAAAFLRRYDEPPEAVKHLFQKRPPDSGPAVQWAWAAGQAKLYLASEIRPDIVEEMFATPLSGPRDVQRLLDAVGHCLLISDAHKRWVTAE